MNKIILSGNIVKANELVNGVVKNSIAVKRDFKNQKGEYETDFFDIVAFNNCATYMSNYIGKGDKVELSGRMQIKTYQSQDGVNRKFYEVVIESISVLTKSMSSLANQEEPEDLEPINDEDDLPF